MKFFRNGGAANDRAPFHDLDFQPPSGEVECANQAIMTRADNKNINRHCMRLQFLTSASQPRAASMAGRIRDTIGARIRPAFKKREI